MVKSKSIIKVPGGVTEILLHTCCAPCSSAIVEYLLALGVRPALFFYNPNIYPEAEYYKRKEESIRHALLLGLPFIDADYDHAKWLERVKGMANEPERGVRCLQCFLLRLTASALFADENGFKVFATTLASSRWKNITQINEAGESAAALFPNLVFWAHNWRTGGLSERRNELIRKYDLYNQSYCGCEYSKRL